MVKFGGVEDGGEVEVGDGVRFDVLQSSEDLLLEVVVGGLRLLEEVDDVVEVLCVGGEGFQVVVG